MTKIETIRAHKGIACAVMTKSGHEVIVLAEDVANLEGAFNLLVAPESMRLDVSRCRRAIMIQAGHLERNA